MDVFVHNIVQSVVTGFTYGTTLRVSLSSSEGKSSVSISKVEKPPRILYSPLDSGQFFDLRHFRKTVICMKYCINIGDQCCKMFSVKCEHNSVLCLLNCLKSAYNADSLVQQASGTYLLDPSDS